MVLCFLPQPEHTTISTLLVHILDENCVVVRSVWLRREVRLRCAMAKCPTFSYVAQIRLLGIDVIYPVPHYERRLSLVVMRRREV
jgi:hypothetical protein